MDNCKGCKSNNSTGLESRCFLLIPDKAHCPCGNCLVKVVCLDLCEALKKCADPQYKSIIPLAYKDGMKDYDS